MAERTLQCHQCGELITTTHPRKIYCNRACSAKAMNLKHRKITAYEPIPCLECSALFTPQRSDSRCCSSKCSSRQAYVERDNWHRMSCALCGVLYKAKRSDSMYCNSRCSKRASYLKARAERIDAARVWASNNRDARRLISGRYKARRAIWEQTPRRYVITARDWNRLLARHHGRCAYCDEKHDRMQVEHVVPLARGGRHSVGNLLPACPPCNGSKNSKLLVEWRHAWRLPASVQVRN